MYTVTFSLRFWYNTNTIEHAEPWYHNMGCLQSCDILYIRGPHCTQPQAFFSGGSTSTVYKQIPFCYDSVSYYQLPKTYHTSWFTVFPSVFFLLRRAPFPTEYKSKTGDKHVDIIYKEDKTKEIYSPNKRTFTFIMAQNSCS